MFGPWLELLFRCRTPCFANPKQNSQQRNPEHKNNARNKKLQQIRKTHGKKEIKEYHEKHKSIGTKKYPRKHQMKITFPHIKKKYLTKDRKSQQEIPNVISTNSRICVRPSKVNYKNNNEHVKFIQVLVHRSICSMEE